MVDSSYIEMFVLLAKPLTEEFDPPWTYIRMIFWGIIPITILSFATGLVIEPTPEYTDIRHFFSNLSLVMAFISAILYLACAWHTRAIIKGHEFEKADRVRRFRD